MNSSDSRSSFTDTAILTLAFSALFLLGLRTISSTDIWMHLAAGRHVAEQGVATSDPFSFGLTENTPWQQSTWLYDWLVYMGWSLGGAPLVLLGHAVAVTGAFFLLALRLRRHVSDLHITWALLVCAWLLAPVFIPHARTMSLLFAALFMFVLSRPSLRSTGIALLVATQAAWSNMHLLFILGPLIVLFSVAEAIMARRRAESGTGDVGARVIALVLVLAATLANPFGTGVWRDVIDRAVNYREFILLEWISPFLTDFLPLGLPWSGLAVAALVVIAVTFVFRRERLPVMLTSCAVLGAFLLVRAGRSPDVAAILVFPFLAIGFETLGRLMSRGTNRLHGIATAAAGLIAVLSIFMVISNRYYVASGSAASFGLRVNKHMFPVAALENMKKYEAIPARMANLAHDGGYLAWALPGTRVYVDSRTDLYGAAFYSAYSLALAGQKDRDGNPFPLPDVDAILLNATWPGTRAAMANLLTGDRWAVAYFDGTSVLMLRRTEANKKFLTNEALSRAGLPAIQSDYARYQNSLGNAIVRPGNPARLIGAASIYQILGRFDESLALLAMITEGSPRMASAWVNRGIAEVTMKKTTQAIASLEHATRMMPEHPLPWLWLSKAYAQDGRTGEAGHAKERGRAISPEAADRFDAEVK